MPAEAEATLTVLHSAAASLRGEEFTLGVAATIGRVSEADVTLPDREVSRQHALIMRQGQQFYIEDLGSLNGTFINGERIAPNQPQLLVSGSEIRLGPTARLLFTEVGATVPANDALREAMTASPTTLRLRVVAQSREVWLNGKRLDPPLSPIQFDLLHLLAEAPGRVFSRDDIAREIWRGEERAGISDEAIDAVIKRLRERLAQIAPDQQIIITVRAHGFKLELP